MNIAIDVGQTTIPFLSADGRIFALVEVPSIDSPLTGSMTQNAAGAADFKVRCRLWFTDACSSSGLEEEMEDLLRFARGQLVAKEYPEPYIKNLAGDLDFSPNLLASLGHVAYLEPLGGPCKTYKAAGYFNAETGHLAVCPENPAGGFTTSEIDTVAHEYFHSVQYAYPAALADILSGMRERWISEGMAKAAERSYNASEMRRSDASSWLQLHEVDVALDNDKDDIPYFAQDFWVYGGRAFGKDIAYFIPILASGLQLADVKFILPGVVNPLDEVYWRWAKNQFMEKDVNFNNGVLGEKCKLDKPVVMRKELWPSNTGSKEGTIGPLESLVVEFRWTENFTRAKLIVVELKSMEPGSKLKYKVYEEGESNCGGSIPDGMRILDDVTMGKTYFVLLSNTTTDSYLAYHLVFE